MSTNFILFLKHFHKRTEQKNSRSRQEHNQKRQRHRVVETEDQNTSRAASRGGEDFDSE